MKKLETVMIAAAAAGAVLIRKYPEAAAIVLLYIICTLIFRKAEEGSLERIRGAAILRADNGWDLEKAVSGPMRLEKFTSRFAKIFTPAMAAAAAAVALIPSLLTGNWTYWVRVGCTFLIIGCVSMLAASVPLACRCGIAAASARGILFKNGGAMETISNMKLVAMGKTGILTDGQYGLQRVIPAIAFEEEEETSGEQQKESEEELILRLCAGAAEGSAHPAAPGILRAAEVWKLHPDHPEKVFSSTEEGVRVKLPEGIVCFGSRKYLQKNGIRTPEPLQANGLQVLAAIDGEYIGTLILADHMRDGAERLVQAMRHVGAKTAVLTEDSEESTAAVAQHLNIDLVRTELTPEKKVDAMKDLRRKGGVTLYLGDGIRDAAVMAAADVSGTLSSGTEEAVQAADILYVGTDLRPVENSIDLAYVTTRIASENVLLFILIRAGILFLGFVGYANLWMTVAAEFGVMIICIINAVRILYLGKYRLSRRTGR